MEKMVFGDITITWLNGGNTHLDGGAMFGVVPKALWSKKYPVNDKNQIELRTDPILIQVDATNILIESGIGTNKMSDKQKRNYGVTEESKIKESLYELGLSSDDIDIILMTHLHFDHACGLTEKNGDEFTSAFKNAKIITSSIEWEEMKNPNIRSKNTYWKENWSPIVEQVQTFSSQIEVLPGIKMVHTGGHSDGHSIITMERNNELLIHMADLMATHAHKNALWVMAYDDYPMDSIEQKQVLLNQGIEKEAWFTFYHDAYFRAIKLGSKGEIISELKRERN